MNQQFAAIPTKFNKVMFRSKLEAQWAIFFTHCGWNWEYEPYELNGWIPDFLIRGPAPLEGRPTENGGTDILVEVKPYADEEEFDLNKIAATGIEAEVLMLGRGPTRCERSGLGSPYDTGRIGWWAWFEPDLVKNGNIYDDATISGDQGAHWFLLHAIEQDYRDRISGAAWGNDGRFGKYQPADYDELNGVWKHIKNLTQWKPERMAYDIDGTKYLDLDSCFTIQRAPFLRTEGATHE